MLYDVDLIQVCDSGRRKGLYVSRWAILEKNVFIVVESKHAFLYILKNKRTKDVIICSHFVWVMSFCVPGI